MAVPVNNEPATATALSGPFGTVSFTTAEATASAGGWANGAGNGLDVWFSALPSRSGAVLLRWAGTDYVPFVQVFESTSTTPLQSSTLVVLDQEEMEPRDYDPTAPPDASDVAVYSLPAPQSADEFTVELTANTMYYVRIHGWTGQTPTTGSGTLEWELLNDPMRVQTPLDIEIRWALAGTLASKFRVVRPTHGRAVYPLLTRSFAVPDTYVVYQGRPIVPIVPMLSNAVMTAARAVVANPSPITITPPNNVPDPPIPEHPPTGINLPTLIWRADTNVTVNANGWATAWNTTANAGPLWYSERPRRPRKSAVGTPKGGSVACLIFNWQYIEHMWIDLSSVPAPWTWLFTGILSTDATMNHHHHLIDVGGSANRDTGIAGKALVHFRPGNVFLQGSSSAWTGGGASLTGKPVVVAASMNGGSSYVATYGSNNDHMYTGNPGNHTMGKMVLGREKGHISRSYASKMHLFEVRLYKGYVNKTQLDAVATSIRSAYKFSDWG